MSKRKRPPKRTSKRSASTARDRISQSRPQSAKRRPQVTGPTNQPDTLWLYGLHAVTAALQNPNRRRHRLIATSNGSESLDISNIMGESALTPEIVDRLDIDAICGEDAVHQGVALLVSPLKEMHIEDIIDTTKDKPSSTIVVLDQASDPRNIGSVMRTARAFGADAIILQDRNSPPETATMAKAASGAMEYIPLVRVTNLARAMWAMKDAGFWVAGLDGYAEKSIDQADITEKQVIVLGAEGSGLRRLTRETCDQTVKIPIDENAESLNLSNAAAIALYAFTRPQIEHND